MFRRREERTWVDAVINFFWPRSGWRRSGRYFYHRLARLPGTPYSVAAGFACGGAISFTPFVGLHFIISAALAWAIRGNIFAAILGTAVGNPWTFPFIWVSTYRLGCAMLGMDPNLVVDTFSLPFLLNSPVDTLVPLLAPMLAGSIPLGFLVWLAIYAPLRVLIGEYKQVRKRRLKKRARLLADQTAANQGPE